MESSILIVEDELDIREALQDILENEGYAVTTAANGHEAFAHLTDPDVAPPKMILLDLLMPVMNGIEFRKQQLLKQDLRDIPVVLMSADKHTLIKMADPSLSYVKKPIEMSELLSTIERHCQ